MFLCQNCVFHLFKQDNANKTKIFVKMNIYNSGYYFKLKIVSIV